MADVNVILDSMHRAMQENPIFGDLLSLEDREFLLNRGTVRAVLPGEILCRKHQRDRRVFVIITGAMEVSEERNDHKVKLGKLQAGELFGEIAAVFMMPRIATVAATKASVVLELPGEVLEELINQKRTLRDAVFERYRDRTILTAFKSVPIFGSLPEDALASLSHHASLMTAKKGEVIIREGEPGDALYIINHGLARVYTTVDDSELNLALLRAGDYFGEWSLLTGAPRAASVAAVSQVDAVRLGCEEFLDFIRQFPGVRDSIDLVAHERRSRTEEALKRPESATDVQAILSEIQQILTSEE